MLNIYKHRNGLNIIPRPDGATAPNAMGDLAVSSVTGGLYYNNGSGISELLTDTINASNVTFVDGTDNTKQLKIDLSGATTGTTTTLHFVQTADRDIIFPDASDTLVGRNTTDTFTNKSIDANSNSISNISNSNLNGSAAIINANLNVMPSFTFKGNSSSSSSIPQDLTISQVNALLGTTGAAVTVGPFDSQPPTAEGLALVGGVLTAQSADATHPGMVNNTTQTFSGQKTFTSTIIANLTSTTSSPAIISSQNNQNIQFAPNGSGIVQVQGSLEIAQNLRFDEAIDTTTTGAQATLTSFSTSYIKVTNVSLGSLSGIPAGSQGQLLVLTNGTGAAFLVNNQDVGVTAANRIITGTNNFITFSDAASLIFIYDSNSSRWRIVGGSGSGGSASTFGTRGVPLAIVAANGFNPAAFNMSTTASNQIIFVVGALGPVIITASPAIQPGTIVGQVMQIVGRDNTNTVTIPNQSGAVELNGDCILGFSDVLSLVFDGTAWVETSRS